MFATGDRVTAGLVAITVPFIQMRLVFPRSDPHRSQASTANWDDATMSTWERCISLSPWRTGSDEERRDLLVRRAICAGGRRPGTLLRIFGARR